MSTRNNDSKKPTQEKRQQVFDSLHREMEIAEYATVETGQRRRKVPRKQGAVRAKKRKILEKVDRTEGAIIQEEDTRLRGSKNALEDDVIQGSQVFAEEAKMDDEEDEEEEDLNEQVDDQVIDEDEDEIYDEEGEEGDEIGEDATAQRSRATAASSSAKALSPSAKKGPVQRKRKTVYRMRNFKSARMAERHGDALGAHARGHSLAAVRKLEQVANDAPTAPQVYSSLGMVYESLLSDSRTKSKNGNEEEVTIKSIEKQLELAKKAYGSYHVAALLCKKDFSLWVRAGDTAKEIADLYTEIMVFPDTVSDEREELRGEKKKWMEEARKDYLAADNQRPPGIDVPAKLAAVQMELGNLSEALVILTDLKNRAAAPGEAHSEFEKSFKAWLLYADLMLRIGHECIQWNNENQENSNYMFRRWLRKWSDSFDWKERRLQALVQALEAAAGTRSCESLILWSKSRSLNTTARRGNDAAPIDQRRWHVDLYEIAKDPPAAKKGEGESKEDTAAANQFELTKESGDSSVWSLDRARDNLLAKNRLELELFDEETGKLGLAADSAESKERASARETLVASQKKSVVDLVGIYQQHQIAMRTAVLNNNNADSAGDNGSGSKTKEPLPISASCANVCSIASELMKHCIRFKLYHGARLTGEVVSIYLKERAGSIERRLESNRSFAEKQKSTAESVLLSMETYDEVGEEESDDEADALYLSDDEVILESSDEHLLPSLKNGILPPEIRLLYSLSLIGEGGRAFLAKQCFKAIELLEADDIDALISDPVDTDIVKDPLWYGFRQDLTESLHKTAAFALAVDVLHKAKREAEYADVVTPLLQRHLKNLEMSGQMDIALFGRGAEVLKFAVPTRNSVIMLILASARMQIQYAETIASEKKEEATKIAFSVLDRIIPLLQTFWHVEANGSVPIFCVEGMQLLSRTFTFLVNLSDEALLFPKLLELLSLLCGVVILDPSTSGASNGEHLFKNHTELPIKAGWQSISHELISKRTYNLAIACLVSNFSGWEIDEFHLDMIRSTNKENRFCVDIGDKRVRGPLTPDVEADLSNQWNVITRLVPQFTDFDFQAHLESAKSSSWYKKVVQDVGESMSAYGEKDAFQLFRMLSRLCLNAANSAKDIATRNSFLKLSLSVVLPLSEFCLDMSLWETQLGRGAITKTNNDYDWNKLAKAVGQRSGDGYSKRRKQQAKPAESTKPTKPVEQAKQAKRPTLPTIIRIPVSELLSQWNEGQPTKQVDSQEARDLMQQVDKATKELRSCYTETAIQKGCIQVSCALLDLLAKGYCYNPFLCLQQAAIFASHGSKGGNNDLPFKAALPRERQCTAQEALVVIGRADCLQSLHFVDEAIYLCSYVARVCRLHRDSHKMDMQWNAQWKVVGICLYNLSVAIRTNRSVQNEDSHPEYFEKEIAEELKRGRADAIAVKSLLPEIEGAPIFVNNQEEESEMNDDYEDLSKGSHNEHFAVIQKSPNGQVDVEMEDMVGGASLPANGGMRFHDSDDEPGEIVAI